MTKVPDPTTNDASKPKHDGCCGGQHDHDKHVPTVTPQEPNAPAKPSQQAPHGGSGHEHSGSGCCGSGKARA